MLLYKLKEILSVSVDDFDNKCLSILIQKLGFSKGFFFTFHTFRRPGASLAYNAHVPIQQIKHHGSWASDCVWTYVQSDEKNGRRVGKLFYGNIVINASYLYWALRVVVYYYYYYNLCSHCEP